MSTHTIPPVLGTKLTRTTENYRNLECLNGRSGMKYTKKQSVIEDGILDSMAGSYTI